MDNDMGNRFHEIQGVSAWPECRDRCRDDGQCDHWTWVPAARCYLKTGQPFAVERREGVVSGINNFACDL